MTYETLVKNAHGIPYTSITCVKFFLGGREQYHFGWAMASPLCPGGDVRGMSGLSGYLVIVQLHMSDMTYTVEKHLNIIVWWVNIVKGRYFIIRPNCWIAKVHVMYKQNLFCWH